MSILVKIDSTAGQRGGDWVVATSGGRTISRHRRKDTAIQHARQEARSRGTDLRIQNATTGQWHQETGAL